MLSKKNKYLITFQSFKFRSHKILRNKVKRFSFCDKTYKSSLKLNGYVKKPPTQHWTKKYLCVK